MYQTHAHDWHGVWIAQGDGQLYVKGTLPQQYGILATESRPGNVLTTDVHWSTLT